jgi:hypothetical protein
MEKSGKVERFSKDQLLLSNSLKSLIKLYYANDYSKPSDAWPWKDLNECISDFIATLHNGRECSYNKSKGKFKLRYSLSPDANEDTILCTYQISDKQMKEFVSVMKKLIAEINNKSFYHLILAGVADELKTELTMTEQWKDAETNSANDNSEQYSYRPRKNTMHHGISLMNRTILKTILKDRPHEHMERTPYSADVSHRRRFRVRSTSRFGRTLLISGKEGATKRISHFTSPKITTFLKLSRYVLIHFHLAFDGFERLKICRVCGELLFEKKKGAKQYCSNPSCKKKYYDSKKIKEKIDCLNRQNAWARNKQLIRRLLSDDCAACNDWLEYKAGGMCKEIIKKIQ